MSHAYSQNVIHLVFSTKGRSASIPREFQPDLWAYIAAICQRNEIHVLKIGGMPDHIHLLLQIPAAISLAKTVLAIKSNSSKWANEKGQKFAWQSGYAAFSVSASIVPAVIRYIENQARHHKKMSFAEEFVALLKKHGVAYDPKFVLG